MLKLARLGVAIIPPVPAFYTQPQTISDIIDFVVSRILDQLGLDNQLTKRW
jgi:4-hydroxy-3-polyprenylbenzoate decarboxylase